MALALISFIGRKLCSAGCRPRHPTRATDFTAIALMRSRRRALLWLPASMVLVALRCYAQSPQSDFTLISAAGLEMSAQRGQGLFLQNCSLCHLPHRAHPKDAADPGHSIGPSLTAWFRDSSTDSAQQAAFTNWVSNGSPHMPSFQYALSSAEIADIAEYLKVLRGVPPGLFQAQRQSSTPSQTIGDAPTTTEIRAQTVISGNVRSSKGQPLGGVALSIRRDAQSFATTVYANSEGHYHFPALEPGDYSLSAQAVGYRPLSTRLTLDDKDRTQEHSLTLEPSNNFEKQLSGSEWMRSLPAATPDDRRLRQIFHNSCTVCHDAAFVLGKRFDHTGWQLIMDVMINHEADPAKPNGMLLQAYRNELIDYLTRARGPKSKPPQYSRPSVPLGEAADVVITEYDIPRGDYPNYQILHNGSLWQEGAPSVYEGEVLHDAVPANDAVYFTDDVTPARTIGKVDVQNGRVSGYELKGPRGVAVSVHGAAVDAQGRLWFADQPDGTFVGFDPAETAFITFDRPLETYPTASGSPVFDTLGNFLAGGMGGTLVVDANGHPWGAQDLAALELQPATGRYRQYRFRDGSVGDPDGIALVGSEVWVTRPSSDAIDMVDTHTGRAFTLSLGRLPVPKPEDDAIGQRVGASTNTAPLYQKGARRIAADPDNKSVWVTEQWAGRLANIDVKTHQLHEYDIPESLSLPFHLVVDRRHRVWFCMLDSNSIGRFDPSSKRFTEFPLPTLAPTARFIALDERRDSPVVWVSYTGSNKIARLQFR